MKYLDAGELGVQNARTTREARMDLSRPVLDTLGDLALIGVEYANGRMTRNDYVEAAVALGLTPMVAHQRTITYDLAAIKVRSPT
jgi:hypothetical protein